MFMKTRSEQSGKIGKMRNGHGIIVWGFVLLFFLAGCKEFTPLELETAPQLVEAVEANRVLDPLSEEEAREKIKEFLYPYEEFNEVDPDQFQLLDGDPPPYIGRKEALEEIDFFFRVLKYGYAGYELFGGDDAFGKSREMVQEEIGYFEEIPIRQYFSIVFNNLSFINDAHFRFAGNSLFTKYQFFSSRRFDFYKDEKGSYYINGEEKLYLESINGRDPEEYIKLSLDDNGKLVYRLGVLLPEGGSEYPVTLSFVEDHLEDRLVYLFPIESLPSDRTMYEYYEKDGLPVIVNRVANPWEEEKMKEFTDDAKALKNTEIAILDIRGHIGGADHIPMEWVKNYTSSLRNPGTARLYADLRTQTAQEIQVRWSEWNDRDSSWAQRRFSPVSGGWSDINYSLPRLKRNDRYLVVLLDSYIASAGESFVRYLKQVENVILIGTNTRGATTVGNVTTYFLPHSTIPVQMGTTLFLELDFSFREGIGIEPDIWVDPKESLELAIKFVDNYLR